MGATFKVTFESGRLFIFGVNPFKADPQLHFSFKMSNVCEVLLMFSLLPAKTDCLVGKGKKNKVAVILHHKELFSFGEIPQIKDLALPRFITR